MCNCNAQLFWGDAQLLVGIEVSFIVNVLLQI